MEVEKAIGQMKSRRAGGQVGVKMIDLQHDSG